MGGEREFVTNDKRGSAVVDGVRVHESKGEVHFHDDSIKLKVAILSHVFWAAWEKIKTGGSVQLIDSANGTFVKIENTFDDKPAKPKISCTIQVASIAVDDTYKQLAAFVG